MTSRQGYQLRPVRPYLTHAVELCIQGAQRDALGLESMSNMKHEGITGAGIERELNSHGYILLSLSDAGARIFETQ